MTGRVFVTRVIPQRGIDMLRERFEVDVNEDDRPLDSTMLEQAAASYDALVTLLTDSIDESVLAAGRERLKIVANVAVGYDNIDVRAATDYGIAVTNTPGVLTDTTADFAWALLMASARRVPEGDRFVRAGKFHGWGIMMLLGQDVHGATLGLIGFGRIGQAVARRARGFEMTILYFDPVVQAAAEAAEVGARHVDLDTLLRESDFISLHTPLTEATHHLIGREQLRAMKPTSILVNTSRGPVIDESALAEALTSREIAAAGLDVFEREPEVFPELLALDNCVLAPHIASASVATRTRMATMAAENVIASLSGERPPTILNPDVLP